MNASSTIDVAACQARCVSTPGCGYFTFWSSPVYRCDLATSGAILASESNVAAGVTPPLSVSGPPACSSVMAPGGNPSVSAPACEELPNASLFPGATPAASAAAWPSGEVPTNAQCWPRNELTGYPVTCPVQNVTVLEDTNHGWPGKCLGLTKIKLPPQQTCESNCKQNVLCAVWQVENMTETPECWQGSMGSSCYHRPGFHAARAQRIMHGTYRVLKDLTGIRVMGMSLMFPPTVFADWREAAAHCRLYCVSALTCQWWQYSKVGGCYAEDVSKSQVAYPFTTDSSQEQSDTDLAEAIVAGEYIQHYCGGDAPSRGADAAKQAYHFGGTSAGMTTSAPAASIVTSTAPAAPQVPVATSGTVAPLVWPTIGPTEAPSATAWVIWAIIAMVVVLCVIVTIIAVASFQKAQARHARRKGRGVTSRRDVFDRYSASEYDLSESSTSFDQRYSNSYSFQEDYPLLSQSFVEMGMRPELAREPAAFEFGMYPHSDFGAYPHQEQSFGPPQPFGLTPPQGLSLQLPFPKPNQGAGGGYPQHPPAF